LPDADADRFDHAVATTRVSGVTALPERPTRVLVAAIRVAVAFLWIQNSYWKVPPHFGADRPQPEGLYRFTRDAVEHPVFTPYAWLVEHVVLPNFEFFGWLVLLVEVSLGAFLLIGLATRLWALVGLGQSLAIALSVLSTPGEWYWAYYLMIILHVLLFAAAAGRTGGLDGVLRPVWSASAGRLPKLLLRVS
jgi:thiosulfate dehydrogenase [quinone] large subunit